MSEIFIKEIKVMESRNIHDFEIKLSDTERKHLILTGKNGSGKTSLLNELNIFLKAIDQGHYRHWKSQRNALNSTIQNKTQLERKGQVDQVQQANNQIRDFENWFKQFGGTEILFTSSEQLWEKVNSGDFLIAFFDAKRHAQIKVPTGINKVNLKQKYSLSDRANKDFIQYIVNMKADRSFARDDGDSSVVESIDKWFSDFEHRLKAMLEVPDLTLRFDRKNYNFDIIVSGKSPFGFNTLADGHSAIISIATELILRMEAHQRKSYDLEGIVLIDEIETHLHVDLQKKVLPFLIDFFPKIQFIVTTHSPFVLSSISEAVICDLESLIVTTDLSGYSYDALIESYFSTDKYSEEIKEKIVQYEQLNSQKKLSPENKEALRFLRNYFAHTPKYLSKELMVKLQQIELKALDNK
jgi:predicted ATP-binding protein involved in virulence